MAAAARLGEVRRKARNIRTARVRTAAAASVRRGSLAHSQATTVNGQTGAPGSSSSSIFGQNSAGGNQTFGGGAIVGVASMSKDPTIRIYNKKKKYNEWQFIYDPMSDQPNVLLRGPYQPLTFGGAQVGTPAGQMNGQQPSPFGQQPGSAPQQTGPGQSGPGSNFPPDQNQPQPIVELVSLCIANSPSLSAKVIAVNLRAEVPMIAAVLTSPQDISKRSSSHRGSSAPGAGTGPCPVESARMWGLPHRPAYCGGRTSSAPGAR